MITQFLYTAGIEAAPVVGRKYLQISSQIHGAALSKIVTRRGAHCFKVHEMAALPGVSAEDLVGLIATASSTKSGAVV